MTKKTKLTKKAHTPSRELLTLATGVAQGLLKHKPSTARERALATMLRRMLKEGKAVKSGDAFHETLAALRITAWITRFYNETSPPLTLKQTPIAC